VEEKNARIKGTTLGIEDHGILTAFIDLDYGSGGQSFGGRSLDEWDEAAKRRVGHAFGSEFILQVLRTLGVSSWEKLPGTPCRVRADWDKVYALGHYLEDKWFDPEAVILAGKGELK
jgi:hypothetical protein